MDKLPIAISIQPKLKWVKFGIQYNLEKYIEVVKSHWSDCFWIPFTFIKPLIYQSVQFLLNSLNKAQVSCNASQKYTWHHRWEMRFPENVDIEASGWVCGIFGSLEACFLLIHVRLKYKSPDWHFTHHRLSPSYKYTQHWFGHSAIEGRIWTNQNGVVLIKYIQTTCPNIIPVPLLKHPQSAVLFALPCLAILPTRNLFCW